jgi:hypothetical protein
VVVLIYIPTSSEWGFLFLPNLAHICTHKKSFTDVYSSSIHNCQKLEATHVYINKWIGKKNSVVIHRMDEPLTYLIIYMNLKGTVLNEEVGLEKLYTLIILSIWYFWKGEKL